MQEYPKWIDALGRTVESADEEARLCPQAPAPVEETPVEAVPEEPAPVKRGKK